jgi:multiple sugar transport system permease protein
VFWTSLWVTLYYTALSVPVTLVVGLGLAMLLNQKIAARGLFRTAFYMPSVIPSVAVAVTWWTIFNPDFGLMNAVLSWFGVSGIPWLDSSDWVVPSLVVVSMWGIGTTMVVYLAGLQGIPSELYEAANIDGAGQLAKFVGGTVPMLSPVILFNVVMSVIASLQIFTTAYVMTRGGPGQSSHFLVLYIFERAWQSLQMGYASALSWVLFLVVLLFTLLLFRLSRRYVYYAGTDEGTRTW